MEFHTHSESYWQYKEHQFSLTVAALLSQSCPSGRALIKNICAAQIGLDGVKERIQNWVNGEGDLRRDVRGADTIKTLALSKTVK